MFTSKFSLFHQFKIKRLFSTTSNDQTEQQIDSLCEEQLFRDLNAELNKLIDEERTNVKSEWLRFSNPKKLIAQGTPKTRVIDKREWGLLPVKFPFKFHGIHYRGVLVPCISLNVLLSFLRTEALKPVIQTTALENLTVCMGSLKLRVSFLSFLLVFSLHPGAFDVQQIDQLYKVLYGTKRDEYKKYYRLFVTPSQLDELLLKKGFLQQLSEAVKKQRNLIALTSKRSLRLMNNKLVE